MYCSNINWRFYGYVVIECIFFKEVYYFFEVFVVLFIDKVFYYFGCIYVCFFFLISLCLFEIWYLGLWLVFWDGYIIVDDDCLFSYECIGGGCEINSCICNFVGYVDVV